jgi:hypothetical protein
MKNSKIYFLYFFIGYLMSCLIPSVLLAADIPHPTTYSPTPSEIEKHKKLYDDPRPYLKEWGPKQILPKGLYEKLCFDEKKMMSIWAELVGFRAPDVVEKIAPEIKPGKYTYKDLEKYPGFKQLMWPDLYKRIRPGGPPHMGNIPEFEIIPTRQYYWALPIAEATKQNEGKTKLDKNGYIIPESWKGGYPFPKPSGEFKVQQIMYNIEKRTLAWDSNMILLPHCLGFTKNLKLDFDCLFEVHHLKLAGRTLIEPYGWFDKRAEQRGESKTFLLPYLTPRDIAGTTFSALYFLDPNKADQLMIYVPSLRRVRKLTATDSQDPVMGQDAIYDDSEGWMQKLSPTRYPYKMELLEEREYLVPGITEDGSEYISSKGLEFRNIKMQRRPLYVIKLTQTDPNYVYGSRIFYIDKETFMFYYVENYNQKGRLYRTTDLGAAWHPEMGMFSWFGGMYLVRDHIDLHSGGYQPLQLPAFWNRDDVSIEGSIKQK